jgi:Serine carboxypeptidase
MFCGLRLYVLSNRFSKPKHTLRFALTSTFFLLERRLYDECTYSNGLKRMSSRVGSRSSIQTSGTSQGGLNDYPCGGDIVMTQYLNLSAVREALHVVKEEFFSVDNAEGDFNYTPTEPDLTDFYKAMNGKLRILVYNGGLCFYVYRF